MRKILFTLIFLVHALHLFAQTAAFNEDDCECKPPSEADIKSICESISLKEKATGDDLDYFTYGYEVRLMKMAGGDIEKDGRELAYKKLQCFWNKYKKRFRCDTVTFNVENGSVIKFAVSQGFGDVLETMVGTYELDICFTDPADNLNICQYLKKQYTNAIASQGKSHPKVAAYKEYIELVDGLYWEEKNLGCPCKLPQN